MEITEELMREIRVLVNRLASVPAAESTGYIPWFWCHDAQVVKKRLDEAYGIVENGPHWFK
jgi:hypothetical protein